MCFYSLCVILCQDMGKGKPNYDTKLSKVYYNEKHPFSYSDANSLKKAFPNVPKKTILEFLQKQSSYSQHKNRRISFQRSKVDVLTIDDTWQTDLLDLPILQKYNDGRRFVLVVQDIFSKYIWLISLKSKKSEEIVKAFKNIFKFRAPLYLASDAGSEFSNNAFKALLKKHGVRGYFLYSNIKAALAERLVRTVKTKIFKIITKTGNFNYISKLPAIAHAYNSRPHSTTGVAPRHVNKKNESGIWERVYGKRLLEGDCTFAPGDLVRLAVAKSVFGKTYTGSFTKEIFVIHNVIKKQPCLYTVKDLSGSVIKGGFYKEELVKIKL